jgi:hypothetical protein
MFVQSVIQICFIFQNYDLWDLLEDYPETKALLIERGKEILRKDLLLDEELEENLKSKCNCLESMIDSLQTRLARLLAEYSASQKKLKQRITFV